MLCNPSKRTLQWMHILGGFLIRTPFCMTSYFGNLASYLYSYFLYRKGISAFDIQVEWFIPTYLAALFAGVFLVDVLERRIRLSYLQLLTILLSDICIFLTYFTVQYSVILTLISLMFVNGFVVGIANMVTFKFVVVVAPERIGLCNSLLTSSLGFGALGASFITTEYLNPDNQSPDIQRFGMVYFSEIHLLDKVPNLFVIFGTIAFGFHVLGFLLQQFPLVYFPSLFASQNTETTIIIAINSNETESETEIHESACAAVDNVRNYATEVDGEDSLNKRSGQSLYENCENTQSCPDLKPSDLLRTRTFYVLWLISASYAFGQILTMTYYKIYGQLWITDDLFLTTVGSVSGVMASLIKIIVGWLTDQIGVNNTFIVTMATNCICVLFWYITPHINKWLYFVLCNFLFGIQALTPVLFPVASLKLYGQKYYSSNFGLILTSLMLISSISPSLLSFLKTQFGWFGLTIVSYISFVLSMVALMVFVPPIR